MVSREGTGGGEILYPTAGLCTDLGVIKKLDRGRSDASLVGSEANPVGCFFGRGTCGGGVRREIWQELII